jgi:hypothetical protein
VGKAGSALPVGAKLSSKYDNVTDRASRATNRELDVTRQEFEAGLSASGWAKSISKSDPMISIFSKDGAKYTVRDKSKSTKGPTAEFFKPGSKTADTKLRLEQPPPESTGTGAAP